jgi:hypothetical protein
MGCRPGDYVAIEFSSADSSAAAAVTLKDANNTTRTLTANERLLIDTAQGECAAAVTLLELFTDSNADGNVGANELICAFGANNAFFDGGEEGYSCPVGVTPKAKGSGAGVVRITGVGRIVNALGRTTRPTWKQAGG